MIVTRAMAEEASKELLIHGLFLQGVTEQVVQEAYRSRARETHPDAGGSAEAFAAVDRAKHVLLKWLALQGDRQAEPAHASDCSTCGGRGYVDSRRAWRTLRVQCTKCRGTGDETFEHEKGDHR